MPGSHNYLLWENGEFTIHTPVNPHIAYSEGLHLYIAPKKVIANAWENPELAAKTFELAAKACSIMEKLGLAPWFNIQALGNWGLLPGATNFFHLHVYGRNKTERWGKPVIIPEAPGTYQNDPMPKHDRSVLIDAFVAL